MLDLILLERIARGLDPGERHLIADRLKVLPERRRSSELTLLHMASHTLLEELQIEPKALFDLISSASRLKMAVRGWVAEQHLERHLNGIDGVTECIRLEGDGKPDISLRWRASKPILVECKNVLRTTYAGGVPKLDFQRTRAAKSDPCSRYYAPGDFHVVAACLHPVTEQWEFRFALTNELPAHGSCPGRIDNNVRVAVDTFSPRIDTLLDRLA